MDRGATHPGRHNRIRTKAADAEGRQRLARYMIRCPFALNKMSYDGKSGMVIYHSKLHATLKRNYQPSPTGPTNAQGPSTLIS